MILRWLAVLLAWLAMLSSLPGAVAGVPQFTVFTNQFAGPPLVGYGVEMSPYLTAPNAGQPVGDWDDLGRKLNMLAPQHVRIFVRTEWWRPGNEKIRDSFVRTCQLAQAAGATINVTLWTGWEGNPAQASADMAGLLKDLIVNRSLGAVRYVTLQNEVNSTKITMEQYNAFYCMFDGDLRKNGIRDKIFIVGGDLVRTRQADWLWDLATNLAPVCDGHSVHIYWDYTQAADAIRRLRGIATVPETFPAAERRPLYITEFGVRGKDWQGPGKEPGVYEDGMPMTQTGLAALQVGWLMTEATRRGFVSTVQWEAYDMAYGKRAMHYGIMGEPGEGWPVRPSYQVLRLFTHTIAPGWRALQVDGDATNVALAAVCGTNGEMTVMVVNPSKVEQTVSVAKLTPGKVFHRVFWSVDEPGRLQGGDDLKCAAGALKLTQPPESVSALTERSDAAKNLGIGSH